MGLPLLLLAPLFALGERGLFESDEGRYVAVAMEMVERGEWCWPRFDEQAPHLSKPPLLYWLIAVSLTIFGPDEWALRLPSVLGLWLGAAGVALAARSVGAMAWPSVWIFASALPVSLAAGIITIDILLTGLLSLAVGSWLRARSSRRPALWRIAAGTCLGLAFLAKGTPALLPLFAIAAWQIVNRRREIVLGLGGWSSFAAIALPWFVLVAWRQPEALHYWLGYEVFARLFTTAHDRHAQWFGFFAAYAWILAVGLLPWLWLLFRRSGAPIKRDGESDAAEGFLRWWLFLPLVLLCLSRSRLPLYVLPLFAPASILLARRAERTGKLVGLLLVGGLLLCCGILLRLMLASLPTHRDARAEAARLAPWLSPETERIVFLGMPAHYGLRFYTGIPVVRAEGTDFVRFRGESWIRLTRTEPSRMVVVVGENIPEEMLAEAQSLLRGARWLSWERVRCGRGSQVCPDLPSLIGFSSFRPQSADTILESPRQSDCRRCPVRAVGGHTGA